MLEARGARRRTGGPLVGPFAAVRERKTMRGVDQQAVALIGFAGGAVIVNVDGRAQQCPIEELRVWSDDIQGAIAAAQKWIDRG